MLLLLEQGWIYLDFKFLFFNGDAMQKPSYVHLTHLLYSIFHSLIHVFHENIIE